MKTLFGKHLHWLCGLLAVGCLFPSQAQTPEENGQTATTFVPAPVTVSALIDTVDGDLYRVHVVQSGHTLYSIARAYNVKLTDIVKHSLGDTVRIGETLYIPYKRRTKAEAPATDTFYTGERPAVFQPLPDSMTLAADTLPSFDSTESGRTICLWGNDTIDWTENPTGRLWDSLFSELRTKQSISVAILLPLYLNDTLDPPLRSYAYLPFLEGWVTAHGEELLKPADSALPIIRYRIWDVTDNPESVNAALNDPELKQADFLIAAVYTKVFDTIRRYAQAHRLPLVHPLTEQDSTAIGNPFYIQCMPAYETQTTAMSVFLKREFRPERYRYILFDDSTVFFRKRAQQLYARMTSDTTDHCDILHYSMSPARMGQFATVFDSLFAPRAARPTVFIGCTDKEIALLNVLIALRKSGGSTEKVFIGPSRWMSFTKIEPEYFKNLRLVCHQPFYWDKDGEVSLRFEKHYYEHFGVLPSDLAYKGYVCYQWFTDMLKQGRVSADPFGCNRWRKRETGGWENTRLFWLELKDHAFVLWPEPEEPEVSPTSSETIPEKDPATETETGMDGERPDTQTNHLINEI